MALFLSNTFNHATIQDFKLSGASVAPTSQVRTHAFGIIGFRKLKKHKDGFSTSSLMFK
jgi:hypothetical protein